MNIAFRVDSSNVIGSGHLMRCLTLAGSLGKHFDANIYFFSRDNDGNANELITTKNFSYIKMSKTRSDYSGYLEHASWLGCSQVQDATEVLNLQEMNALPAFDFLFVDHYAIDKVWETEIRKMATKVFVIDDLADRIHNCDFLLDQNFLPKFKTRYKGLVPENCHELLGNTFALLRQEFVAERLKLQEKKITNKPPKILVNFGGSDSSDQITKFLHGYLQTNMNKYELHIVTGKNHHNIAEIQSIAASLENCKVYAYLENMAEHLSKIDFVIGASGSSLWERFCLGINSAVVSVALNQEPLAKYLSEESLVDYIGNLDTVDASTYKNYIDKLDLEATNFMHRKNTIMNLIDGNGASRIINEISRYE